MKHIPWLQPVILILLAIAADIVSLTSVAAGLRPLIVLCFVCICPGMAFIKLLQLRSAVIEWMLAIALSLTIAALVASLQLYTHHWSAVSTTLLLSVLCITISSIHLIVSCFKRSTL